MAIYSINTRLFLLLGFALISLQDLDAENLTATKPVVEHHVTNKTENCSQATLVEKNLTLCKQSHPLIRTWRFIEGAPDTPTHSDKIKVYVKRPSDKKNIFAEYAPLGLESAEWGNGIMKSIDGFLIKNNYERKDNASIYLKVEMEDDGKTSYYNAYIKIK